MAEVRKYSVFSSCEYCLYQQAEVTNQMRADHDGVHTPADSSDKTTSPSMVLNDDKLLSTIDNTVHPHCTK